MAEKENSILEKIEDAVEKQVETYLSQETMSDKDIYNLHMMVTTIGKIRGIRDGTAYNVYS